MSTRAFNLFADLFLGNRQEHMSLHETRKKFKEWGIMHYLARSGLHLIFFIYLLNLLFKILPLPFMIRQLISLLILLSYSLLSWPSVSFNRALFALMLKKVGLLLKMQLNLLNILSCVCCITLYRNPILISFLDFQLSFGITYALIYFNVSSEKNK